VAGFDSRPVPWDGSVAVSICGVAQDEMKGVPIMGIVFASLLGIEIIGGAWCWALGIETGQGRSRALHLARVLADVGPRGYWARGKGMDRT
jgi:hypothetical protein